MNPCRLHALYAACPKAARQQAADRSAKGANGKPTQYIDFDEPITEHKNLAELFLRGE